jgi:hypothetical protein
VTFRRKVRGWPLLTVIHAISGFTFNLIAAGAVEKIAHDGIFHSMRRDRTAPDPHTFGACRDRELKSPEPRAVIAFFA